MPHRAVHWNRPFFCPPPEPKPRPTRFPEPQFSKHSPTAARYPTNSRSRAATIGPPAT